MPVTTSLGSLEMREVAPRLFAPALIWVLATHLGPEKEFDARLQVVPQATSKDRPGRLYCRRVEVEPRREDGPAVTGEVLRSVPVAYLITQAAGYIMVRNDDGAMVQRPSVWLSPEEATRLREQGPVTETLREVAIIYRIANVVGESPTRAVEHQFGVSKATAGRWVSLARIKEHLAPSEGPGKAGG